MVSCAIYHQFQGCLAAPNPSHGCRFFCQRETYYKLAKGGDLLFDAIIVIAKATHAPPSTLKHIAYTRIPFRVVRDILGVIHLFTGVIPGLLYAMKLFWDLAKGLRSNTDVVIHPHHRQNPSYNEVAKTTSEKIICVAAVSFKCIQSTSSLIAFAVCRPILCMDLLKIPLYPEVRSLGESYHILTLVKHSAGLAGYACEMGYQYQAFQRALEEEENPFELEPIYNRKIIESTTAVVEKILQIVYDIAKLLEKTVHPAFRIPLAFFILLIGLYRVWQKTA